MTDQDCKIMFIMAKVWGVSADPTILHTFLSMPACTACTDMVYSKELERDITTSVMAKALLRLKTLASFLRSFLRPKNKFRAVMYMPCENALVLN